MSVSLGTMEFEDNTTMGVLTDRGETRVLWFSVKLSSGEVLNVVTKCGKESLTAAEVRPLKVDVELPIDISVFETIDKITIVSDLVNFSEVKDMPVVRDGHPNEFLLVACHLVTTQLVANRTNESLGKDTNVISILREVVESCNVSKEGWKLFGMLPVTVKVNTTVENFKHSDSVSDEARKLLAGSLLRKSMPVETIASKLMCSDIIASGIMDGKVELSLTNFITLCKLAEHKPEDVLRAVGNNLAKVPEEWEDGE